MKFISIIWFQWCGRCGDGERIKNQHEANHKRDDRNSPQRTIIVVHRDFMLRFDAWRPSLGEVLWGFELMFTTKFHLKLTNPLKLCITSPHNESDKKSAKNFLAHVKSWDQSHRIPKLKKEKLYHATPANVESTNISGTGTCHVCHSISLSTTSTQLDNFPLLNVIPMLSCYTFTRHGSRAKKKEAEWEIHEENKKSMKSPKNKRLFTLR